MGGIHPFCQSGQTPAITLFVYPTRIIALKIQGVAWLESHFFAEGIGKDDRIITRDQSDRELCTCLTISFGNASYQLFIECTGDLMLHHTKGGADDHIVWLSIVASLIVFWRTFIEKTSTGNIDRRSLECCFFL